MSNKILNYQQRVWKDYKSDLGLDSQTFLYGNPLKVHVPIDTAENSVMIIGAYPTAHFNVIQGIRDVPVEDHLYPFSNEKYFDGSSVNCVKSGEEIEMYLLRELNVQRKDCWITDLVKIFLFKEGHIRKYNQLGYAGFHETRSQFMDLAIKSRKYIYEEIELATPSVIVGLGTEVNSVMLDMTGPSVQKIMSEGAGADFKVRDHTYKYFPVAHPGILMRGNEQSVKWRTCLNISIGAIKKHLQHTSVIENILG